MAFIAVSGNKGGVGKTTTALNLAGLIARRTREPVLAVDADSRNRSLSSWKDQGLNFDILEHEEHLRLVTKYRHIIYDLPGNPEGDNLPKIARGVDLMVLPLIPDRLSIDPVLALADQLGDAHWRMLITLAPTYPATDGERTRDKFRSLNLPVFETVIHRLKVYREAANTFGLAEAEYEKVFDELARLPGFEDLIGGDDRGRR
jgi:chromosome partitioning protein